MQLVQRFTRQIRRMTLVLAALLCAVLGGLVLRDTAQAQCLVEQEGGSCSAGYTLIGGPQSISGGSSSEEAVDHVFLPTSGQITHGDMVAMEAEAHKLLDDARTFRLDISPHNERPGFDAIVRQYNYDAGFEVEYEGGVTLAQRIEEADANLRLARDIYAFLAVYADLPRFRTSPDFVCPDDVEEDPFADNPPRDRCKFAARMRESLRENAYLHMIFGQQFAADALGLNFSADTVGAEALVLTEVKQLEMAVTQYDLALEVVQDGLRRGIGNGCYVSDFYTAAEWALLSRAVDGRQVALSEMAARKSYLDGYGVRKAEDDYRATSINQYINLIGTNGIAGRPPEERCTVADTGGEDPSNDMLAEMAIRMADTRLAYQNLQAGRNIFGYDVRFTPARPYHTPFGSNDKGLFEEAKDAAEYARELQ
ncbi:MAG: hypothetical protein KDE20_13665, partial [Caldilineaceae bacterium]|nr:hypothetical protein [Caldilineaceae bacterium]